MPDVSVKIFRSQNFPRDEMDKAPAGTKLLWLPYPPPYPGFVPYLVIKGLAGTYYPKGTTWNPCMPWVFRG